ncbi:MAG: hypothetical protein KGI51_03410 [Rhodospirillales bacterium]|nr:hypothetical protein [Rhodospirillales bacterium]
MQHDRDAWLAATAGRLVGSLSHDLNNLVAAMIGGLDLLDRRAAVLPDATRAPIASLAGRMRNATDRAAALAAALGGLGRVREEAPVTDLASLTQRLAPALATAAGRRVALTLDVSPDAPSPRATAAELRTALLALAFLARAGLPEGGAARIALGPAVLGGRPALALRLEGATPPDHDPALAGLVEFATAENGSLTPTVVPPGLALLLPARNDV